MRFLRSLCAALCALALASAAQAQVYRPGFSPAFRSGFQFINGTLAVYDFAGGSYPAVTVSRASTGYVADLAGAYTSVAADTLRRSNRGALIEPAATNRVRNSAGAGAVAGSPGTLPTNWSLYLAPAGLSRTVVGTGTTNGVEWVDIRVTGTSTSGGEMTLGPEANSVLTFPASSALSGSMFAALSGGTLSGVNGISLRGISYNGSSYLTESGTTISLTSTLTRFSLPFTSSATSNSVLFALTLQGQSGAAFDFTIRVGWPQVETGSVASSPVRTTSASATRAADAASITIPAGASRIIYTFDDGSTQQVSASPGAYTIPTSLNRPYIARATVLP